MLGRVKYTFVVVPLAALIAAIGASGRMLAGPAGYTVYSVREDGTARHALATVPTTLFGSDDVWLVTRSPAKDRFLAARSDGIFVANLDGSNVIRLSPGGEQIPSYAPPLFSPNGRLVAFSVTDPGCMQPNCNQLYVSRTDGTGLKLLAKTAADPSWSADGKWIAYAGDLDFDGGRGSIYLVHPDGSGLRRIATDGTGVYGHPSFAPSGTRLAYGCTAGLCLTLGTRHHVISRSQGALWSPDGRRIAQSQASNGVNHSVLSVVDIATATTRPLTSSDINGTSDMPLAWSPDGSTLAFLRACEYPPPICRIAVYALNLANGSKHRLSRDAHSWMDVRWSNHTLTYVAATG